MAASRFPKWSFTQPENGRRQAALNEGGVVVSVVCPARTLIAASAGTFAISALSVVVSCVGSTALALAASATAAASSAVAISTS